MATIETWALHRLDPILVGKLDFEQYIGLEYPLTPDHASVETTDGIEAESFGPLRFLPRFTVSTTLGSIRKGEAKHP